MRGEGDDDSTCDKPWGIYIPLDFDYLQYKWFFALLYQVCFLGGVSPLQKVFFGVGGRGGVGKTWLRFVSSIPFLSFSVAKRMAQHMFFVVHPATASGGKANFGLSGIGSRCWPFLVCPRRAFLFLVAPPETRDPGASGHTARL